MSVRRLRAPLLRLRTRARQHRADDKNISNRFKRFWPSPPAGSPTPSQPLSQALAKTLRLPLKCRLAEEKVSSSYAYPLLVVPFSQSTSFVTLRRSIRGRSRSSRRSFESSVSPATPHWLQPGRRRLLLHIALLDRSVLHDNPSMELRNLISRSRRSLVRNGQTRGWRRVAAAEQRFDCPREKQDALLFSASYPVTVVIFSCPPFRPGCSSPFCLSSLPSRRAPLSSRRRTTTSPAPSPLWTNATSAIVVSIRARQSSARPVLTSSRVSWHRRV